MTTLSNIPKGATIQARKRGVVNSVGDKTHGKPAEITVFADTCGYAKTPTAWFVITLEGKALCVKRCSGRNYAKAMEAFNDCADLIQEVKN